MKKSQHFLSSVVFYIYQEYKSKKSLRAVQPKNKTKPTSQSQVLKFKNRIPCSSSYNQLFKYRIYLPPLAWVLSYLKLSIIVVNFIWLVFFCFLFLLSLPPPPLSPFDLYDIQKKNKNKKTFSLQNLLVMSADSPIVPIVASYSEIRFPRPRSEVWVQNAFRSVSIGFC